MADNEPNNHLYSLGKFVHTGLHSRHLIVQSHGSGEASGPAASNPGGTMPLPPRHFTMSGDRINTNVTAAGGVSASSAVVEAAAASQPDQHVSGSSSEVTSPRLEPVAEAQPPAVASMGGVVDASGASPQRSHTVTLPFSKTKPVSHLKAWV